MAITRGAGAKSYRSKRAISGPKKSKPQRKRVSTSSAASSFTKAQKRTYAKLNSQRSAAVRTKRMRNATPVIGGSRSSGSKGLKNYGPPTPGGSIGQAHQSFFDIGKFLKGL